MRNNPADLNIKAYGSDYDKVPINSRMTLCLSIYLSLCEEYNK